MFKNTQRTLTGNDLVSQEHLTSYNPTGYDILSGKVDFTKKLGKDGKLELGVKASHVVSDNELLFYEVTDGRRYWTHAAPATSSTQKIFLQAMPTTPAS
ncbi:hypothetical protein O71_22249 [Pontibacter sp. BAB1700]|nr:hypothetical protein O71_22249 [Pontibacter sp. BAB1700]